jgi:hypothetical protein
MKCPKCNYGLVFLSSRMKYKCSLCSKLYLKKESENKTFRTWNIKQREIDDINLNIELNQRLNEFKEAKKALKTLFRASKKSKLRYRRQYYLKNNEKLKAKFKEYYKRNKDWMLEQDDLWRERNKERYLLTYKNWLLKNKDKRTMFLKTYIINNISLEKQKLRLAYWRNKQNLLADQYLKNKAYGLSTIKFYPFPPAFSLCELLLI